MHQHQHQQHHQEESENVNHLRKSFAIKRAKDLAENARLLLQKDKQIEELRHVKKSISLNEEETDRKFINSHTHNNHNVSTIALLAFKELLLRSIAIF